MNKARYDIWCVYSLFAFGVLAFGGWLFAAGFLPPWDPTWEASKIAELYQEDYLGIQIGMIMLMLGCALYLPFCVITSELLEKRMGMPILAKIQLSAVDNKVDGISTHIAQQNGTLPRLEDNISRLLIV